MLVVLRLAALAFDLARVVEADLAGAVRGMHGQRVVEAMRLLRVCRHLLDDEPYPEPGGIDHQHLAVQVQEVVERWIMDRVVPRISLSQTDK